MKPKTGFLLAEREKNEKKEKNGEVHRPHHGLRVQADIRKGNQQGFAHIAPQRTLSGEESDKEP